MQPIAAEGGGEGGGEGAAEGGGDGVGEGGEGEARLAPVDLAGAPVVLAGALDGGESSPEVLACGVVLVLVEGGDGSLVAPVDFAGADDEVETALSPAPLADVGGGALAPEAFAGGAGAGDLLVGS